MGGRVKRPATANGGWYGLATAALLVVASLLNRPPSVDETAAVAAVYYDERTALVVLAVACTLAAALTFLAFSLRFALAATPGPAAPEKWRLTWSSGVLVVAAVIVAALPSLVLAFTSRAQAAGDLTYPLVQLTASAAAAVSFTASLYLAVIATQGLRLPVWLRGMAAAGGVVLLLHAVAGFLRYPSLLDVVAPLTFAAVVLAASLWLLTPRPEDAPPEAEGTAGGAGPDGNGSRPA
jgi:hypothetical protein